jgi:signal peptidase I
MEPDTQAAKASPRWQHLIVGRNPRRTLIRIGVVVLLTIIVFRFCVQLIRITGISMFPTYRDGQIQAVNRLAYLWADPKRYDIVLVKPPGTTDAFLKRIIALPGEKLSMLNGVAYINGRALSEPYLTARLPWTTQEPIVMGENEYYVVGDNRSMPPNYHAKGIVNRQNIVGRVMFEKPTGVKASVDSNPEEPK